MATTTPVAPLPSSIWRNPPVVLVRQASGRKRLGLASPEDLRMPGVHEVHPVAGLTLAAEPGKRVIGVVPAGYAGQHDVMYFAVPDSVASWMAGGGEVATASPAGITFLADVVLAEDGAPGGQAVSGMRGASSTGRFRDVDAGRAGLLAAAAGGRVPRVLNAGGSPGGQVAEDDHRDAYATPDLGSKIIKVSFFPPPGSLSVPSFRRSLHPFSSRRSFRSSLRLIEWNRECSPRTASRPVTLLWESSPSPASTVLPRRQGASSAPAAASRVCSPVRRMVAVPA